MSNLIPLGKKVRDVLNAAPGGTFSAPHNTWSATFQYLARLKRQDVGPLQVVVAPIGRASVGQDDRCGVVWDYLLGVAVIKRLESQDVTVPLDAGSDAEMSALFTLSEEIMDYMALQLSLMGFGLAALDHNPIAEASYLEDRIFFGILELTYRG